MESIYGQQINKGSTQNMELRKIINNTNNNNNNNDDDNDGDSDSNQGDSDDDLFQIANEEEEATFCLEHGMEYARENPQKVKTPFEHSFIHTSKS